MISDKQIVTVVIPTITGLKSDSGTKLFLPEIIKVRERVLHIGLIPRAIPLKTLYPVLPSMLLALCVDVYVEVLFMSFRFKE